MQAFVSETSFQDVDMCLQVVLLGHGHVLPEILGNAGGGRWGEGNDVGVCDAGWVGGC